MLLIDPLPRCTDKLRNVEYCREDRVTRYTATRTESCGPATDAAMLTRQPDHLKSRRHKTRHFSAQRAQFGAIAAGYSHSNAVLARDFAVRWSSPNRDRAGTVTSHFGVLPSNPMTRRCIEAPRRPRACRAPKRLELSLILMLQRRSIEASIFFCAQVNDSSFGG